MKTEVAIVGGGPGGSAAAMSLSNRSARSADRENRIASLPYRRIPHRRMRQLPASSRARARNDCAPTSGEIRRHGLWTARKKRLLGPR